VKMLKNFISQITRKKHQTYDEKGSWVQQNLIFKNQPQDHYSGLKKVMHTSRNCNLGCVTFCISCQHLVLMYWFLKTKLYCPKLSLRSVFHSFCKTTQSAVEKNCSQQVKCERTHGDGEPNCSKIIVTGLLTIGTR